MLLLTNKRATEWKTNLFASCVNNILCDCGYVQIMSWRFKASKYKNAAPKIPKPDEWLRELSIGSYQVNGQIIKASASLMAFNADVAGWY